MRPQTAHQIINNAMSKFYTIPKDDNIDVSLLKTNKCRRALKKMLDLQIQDMKRICKEDGYEYVPIEPYYIDTICNPEYVQSHLFYVSDRWCCEGRIKFLMEVIERY